MRWNSFNPHKQSKNSVPNDKDEVLYIIESCVFLIGCCGMKTTSSITFYLPSNSDKVGFLILGMLIVIYVAL
jgi:uncharacterized membrane-anchored protein